MDWNGIDCQSGRFGNLWRSWEKAWKSYRNDLNHLQEILVQ